MRHTRFTKAEIDELVQLLDLQSIKYRFQYSIPPRDALAIVMTKLAAPTYLHRDQDLLRTSAGRLSTIVTDTELFLARRYEQLLIWHPSLRLAKLKEHAVVLSDFGGQSVIWGLIDGTFRPFCRPLDGQRFVYSGHKHLHSSKW